MLRGSCAGRSAETGGEKPSTYLASHDGNKILDSGEEEELQASRLENKCRWRDEMWKREKIGVWGGGVESTDKK